MSYTLIGSPISPFVRKVSVLLQEKGLEFEQEDVNPFAPPDGYRAISPLGKIPAFRHDDRIVNDSSVICRYIDRLNPSPSFYPADPFDCARAEWIEEYSDGGLVPVGGGKIFFPLVIEPLMTGKEPDESGPQKAIAEELPVFYDYLESQLQESGYFVGDSMSIADLTVGAGFVSMRLAGVTPAAARWPKLAAFQKRMHARESFQNVIKPVVAMLGKRWVEID